MRRRVQDGDLVAALELRRRVRTIVYAVIEDVVSPDFPLGDSLEVFIRRGVRRAVR
jgi:hypothetical protein